MESLNNVLGKPEQEQRAVLSILEELIENRGGKNRYGEEFSVLLQREIRRGGKCVIIRLAEVAEKDFELFKKILSCLFTNINKASITRLIFYTGIMTFKKPELRLAMLSHMRELSRAVYPGNREKLMKKLGIISEESASADVRGATQ